MSTLATTVNKTTPLDVMNRPTRDNGIEMKPEPPIEETSPSSAIKHSNIMRQDNTRPNQTATPTTTTTTTTTTTNSRVVIAENVANKSDISADTSIGSESRDQIKSNINNKQANLSKMEGVAASPKDGLPIGRDKSTATKKASNTTTLSRFKEKRPEPLKLNPNINQETPLDLSVKSAGNVPSGTLSSIFNSHLATLETPRIQWQDTDALLAAGKNRLTSCSTNANHRAPISTLVGESPPVTPSSPLIEMILTSSRNQSKSGDTNLAANSILDPSILSDAAYESKKAQILDRWSQTNKLQSSAGPRRSCSTDNLNLHNSSSDNHLQQTGSDKFARLRVKQEETGGNTSKKNSISPLATNSLSNTTQNEINSSTKFSYSNQPITSNSTDTQKPLTPTNVANATANLLNIHLNSPPAGSQAQSSMASSFGSNYKTTSFSSIDHEPSPLDPLISAAFCQQQQQLHNQHQQHQNNGRNSINFSTSSLSSDLNNNILMPHHNISSISSSATLNTPTLISPSQLKAGQLCFLPSPTLSPMSSVFDLPSPFLMFPPSSTKQVINNTSHSHTKTTDSTDQETLTTSIIRTNSDNISNKIPRSTNSINGAASANDLSHLITSATGKTSTHSISKQEENTTNDNDEEIDMDIELDMGKPLPSTNGIHREVFPRPATVIPQICVSDDQAEGISRSNGQSREGRSQRDPSSKRSLSPKSFRIQVKNYRTERLESSSAPPDIEQRRVRAKIKAIGADSCSDIVVHKNELVSYEINDKDTTRSQLTINQHCRTAKPYPEVLGTRASSAEPTIFSRVSASRGGSTSAVNSADNVAQSFYPSDGQLSQQEITTCLSQSAQQLNASLYQPNISKQQQHQTDSAFQQNHQSQQANNHNYHYYSQQQQQQLQQQHSVSAGELNKIHSQSNQRQPMMMMMMNGSGVSDSQYCGPPRQQLGQPVLLSHQQHFTNQSNSSSLPRVDSLTNNYQQTLADQRRQHQSSIHIITDSVSSMMRNQPLVKNFCNGESICPQQILQQNLNTSQRYLGNALTSQQNQPQQQQPTMRDTFAGVKLANGLNYSYQIDIETRSDSRSSSSLDFPGPYVGSGSRPNSAASSNLASKKYHCDMCSKSFTRSDMLTRHRRLHSGDRPFQCGECKQEFSRSDHLSTHMRTHTGEKPYKCKLCSYSACRKDMITRHLKVHSRSPNASDFA